MDLIDSLGRLDQGITLAQVATIVDIRYGNMQDRVHDDLVYHKIGLLWVPKEASGSDVST